MFASNVYRERRAALYRQMGGGLLLLPGLSPSPVNFAANPYPFRQDSSFLYYVGVDRPDCTLVVDLDRGRETLCGPEDSLEDAIWSGPRRPLPEYAARAGIDRWRQEKHWSDFIVFDKLAPFRRFGGIRIEDVVLVTPQGARVLGPVIPKTAATVEAACAV